MVATVTTADTSTAAVAAAAARIGYTPTYPDTYTDGPAGAASSSSVAAPATSTPGVT